MSRRIFVRVNRGAMDKTAVCVFPWELPILELVHSKQVEEVSIEEMAKQKEGVVKVEKLKLKHTDQRAPDIASQLQAMAYVNPEEDPANDPAAEYDRLIQKYGMDVEFPVSCVERVYGQFSAGAFEAKVREFAKDRVPMPTHMRAVDEGLGKHPKDMTVKELRDALKERGVKWKITEGKDELAAKLEAALAPEPA